MPWRPGRGLSFNSTVVCGKRGLLSRGFGGEDVLRLKSALAWRMGPEFQTGVGGEGPQLQRSLGEGP